MSEAPVVVTGATGFVGGAVARALVAQGQRVRVVVRRGADLANLEGLSVERALGDVCDAESMRAALVGARGLYHVAARYSLWSRDAGDMYRSNVEGTRTVLQAALEAGVERVVYTSSVGTLGIPATGSGTEDTPVAITDMVGAYKRSKFMAEAVSREFVSRGLPVVIVNPSTPIGARDLKPTPTGQVVVDFLRGRMPAIVETGLNYVSVEDVATGHLLAYERGEVGRRYILGNQNLSLGEFLGLVAQAAGRRPPRFKVPLFVALAAGVMSEAASYVTGRQPQAPIAGVLMARKKMYFDASRAVQELELPQTPVLVAVQQAVRWFFDNGYAR